MSEFANRIGFRLFAIFDKGKEEPERVENKERMSSPNYRGPRSVSDILGELFATRGYGRLHAQKELEEAWKMAVGEPGWRQTRVGEVRRGILNVTVAHSTLLEELAAYQKPRLLATLRQHAPGTVIHDIRFRVGPLEAEEADSVRKARRSPRAGTKGKTKSQNAGDAESFGGEDR